MVYCVPRNWPRRMKLQLAAAHVDGFPVEISWAQKSGKWPQGTRDEGSVYLVPLTGKTISTGSNDRASLLVGFMTAPRLRAPSNDRASLFVTGRLTAPRH
jgi:hypothetical protein